MTTPSPYGPRARKAGGGRRRSYADDCPEGARLAVALRELRDRTGMTFSALAATTPHSRSSWERYLNGKAKPPRVAVAALCEAAGEPPARCMALWDLADAAWSGRSGRRRPAPPREPADADTRAVAAPAPAPTPTPTPAPAPADAAETYGHPPRPGRRFRPGPRLLRWGRSHPLTLTAAVLLVACGTGIGLGALVTGVSAGPPGRTPVSRATAQSNCAHGHCGASQPSATQCPEEPLSYVEYSLSGGNEVSVRYASACRKVVWLRVLRPKVGYHYQLKVPGAPLEQVLVRHEGEGDGVRFSATLAYRKLTDVHVCVLPRGQYKQNCFRP